MNLLYVTPVMHSAIDWLTDSLDIHSSNKNCHVHQELTDRQSTTLKDSDFI